MKRYLVLHRPFYLAPADAPEGFTCMADDTDHAEEQCANACPDSDIVWIVEGDDLGRALNDYWGIEIEQQEAQA